MRSLAIRRVHAMQPARRQFRLAEEIRHELGVILARNLRDSRVGFVTVTDVKMTPDLKLAKVFVSVLGTSESREETMRALEHATPFIRRELCTHIRFRRAPEIRFVYDDTEERGARIDRILEEIRHEQDS